MTQEAEGRRALHVGISGSEASGGGPDETPIILLHAFPLDSRMWGPLIGELAGCRAMVLGFDYPGFGATPSWPGTEPSIDAIADAAVRGLDRIGTAKAHWVGCSMGGYVALAVAERHPERVAGLGLVDTRSTADDDRQREARFRAADEMTGLRHLPDPLGSAEFLVGLEGEGRSRIVERAAAIIGSADPAAVAWGQRAMAARPDRTGVLHAFRGSSVVVWGERDTVSSLSEAERMAEALGVSVTRIPGAGHLSPLEAPSAVAEALAPLVRRLTAQG